MDNQIDPIKLIGQKLSEDETRRDAVHIAIMPVKCGEGGWLHRGETVRFDYGSKEVVGRCSMERAVGIIDPYLPIDGVAPGERCWMFMFPGTVTGMRHEWSHPALVPVSEPGPLSESELWLQGFADKWNFNYTQMIEQASTTPKPGNRNYITADGIDLHKSEDLGGEDHALFWQHLAQLTGKQFSNEHIERFVWSCSC